MCVSGLVIRFAADPAQAEVALAALRGERCVTLGEPHAGAVPAVLEVADVQAAREAHDRLQALPGVAMIQVVFVEVD